MTATIHMYLSYTSNGASTIEALHFRLYLTFKTDRVSSLIFNDIVHMVGFFCGIIKKNKYIFGPLLVPSTDVLKPMEFSK